MMNQKKNIGRIRKKISYDSPKDQRILDFPTKTNTINVFEINSNLEVNMCSLSKSWKYSSSDISRKCCHRKFRIILFFSLYRLMLFFSLYHQNFIIELLLFLLFWKLGFMLITF